MKWSSKDLNKKNIVISFEYINKYIKCKSQT